MWKCSIYLFVHCVYDLMCMYACWCGLCIQVSMHTCRGQPFTDSVSPSLICYLLKSISYWTWSLPIWLDWMATELQVSGCLCLPSNESINTHHQIWIFTRAMEGQFSVPHAYMEISLPVEYSHQSLFCFHSTMSQNTYSSSNNSPFTMSYIYNS